MTDRGVGKINSTRTLSVYNERSPRSMLLADLDRKDFAYLSTTPFPWARHPSIRILWIPARE